MKYFSQINKILSNKQKKFIYFLTILSIISMLFEILTLNILFLLLNFMSNPATINESQIFVYIENLKLNYNMSVIIISLFIGIFTLKTFANIFISWEQNKFSFNTRAELSHTYFEGYLCLPSIFHLRSNTSDLIKNITTEVDHFIVAIQALIIILIEVIIISGISFFLLFINFKITIMSITSLVLFSLIYNFINTKKILIMGKSRVKVYQQRLKSIIEGLSGSKIFELTGSQKNLVKDFSVHNDKLANLSRSVGFRADLPRPLFEIFILLITSTFLILNFSSHANFKEIIPLLGIFLTAAYRLIPSFGRILTNLQKFQFSIQAAKNLSKDIEKFNYQNNLSKNEVIQFNFEKNISFENVAFSYNEKENLDSDLVLKNVNLKIKKGSKIGIVGGSGSGKSTFLDLLMGLIYPQNGTILIDGQRIKNIKSQWQKNIGCVPQDVFILDDTFKRNIAFGLPNELIDEQKVNNALESANLTQFKDSLEFGLETLLGESGSRLSGGQKQRIGIARALYTNPNILIFDEATNALDSQTEKKIINEIFSAKKSNTIIFVSHNRENLVHCDLVYEVKNKTLLQTH